MSMNMNVYRGMLGQLEAWLERIERPPVITLTTDFGHYDGYVGTINNALIIHPPTDGNRCIEGDNIASTRISGGTASTLPLTKPTIRHMTCIPSNFDVGTHGDSEGPIIRYGARMILIPVAELVRWVERNAARWA